MPIVNIPEDTAKEDSNDITAPMPIVDIPEDTAKEDSNDIPSTAMAWLKPSNIAIYDSVSGMKYVVNHKEYTISILKGNTVVNILKRSQLLNVARELMAIEQIMANAEKE